MDEISYVSYIERVTKDFNIIYGNEELSTQKKEELLKIKIDDILGKKNCFIE